MRTMKLLPLLLVALAPLLAGWTFLGDNILGRPYDYVTVRTPDDNDVLTYRASDGRWIAAPAGGGAVTSDASSSVKGISKLSVNPVSASDPIALAFNDPTVNPTPTAANQGKIPVVPAGGGAYVHLGPGTATTVLHGNAAGVPTYGAVALADMATQAAKSLLGNGTNGTATPTALTGTANQIPIVNSGNTALAFTTVSGDLTNATGVFTISNNAVSLAKMADVSGLSLLGKGTTGTGDPTNFTGTANQIPIVNSAGSALAFTSLTGDVTNATGVMTIANNAVTVGKMAQLAAVSLLGNGTNATANMAAITGTANQIPIVNSTGTALAFVTLSGVITNVNGVTSLAIDSVGKDQIQAGAVEAAELSAGVANRINSVTATNGGVVYGNGTNYSTSAAGTAGQILQSAGAASPVWVDATGAYYNAILNSEFMVVQRGTSFAAIADGTYSLDRWKYNKVGAAVHTVSQSTTVPTFAQAGKNTQNSALLAMTTPDTTIAAGDFVTFSQPIEGYRWLHLDQKALVLTFWVSSPITGVHCVALRNSGNDRSCVMEYTVNAANTYELKTVLFPASPTAGTWNYTTGVGANLTFTLAGGSTFQTTAGSWQTGNFFSTANQVNAVNTGLTNFRLAMVQLTPGTTAQAFESVPFEKAYFACRRYCVVLGGNVASERFALGFNISTVLSDCAFQHVPSMRGSPAISNGTVGDFRLFDSSGGSQTVTAIAASQTSREFSVVRFTVASGLTTGAVSTLLAQATTNARLIFDAEL